VGWNVACQPGYVAEEAVVAATDGLGDGRETSGRRNDVSFAPPVTCVIQPALLRGFAAPPSSIQFCM